MSEIKLQKPFLKWVGGKTQLINNIITYIPNEINNYHEPFLGGGSVLFTILSLQKEKKIKIHNKIYAYDANTNLINTYNKIKDKKDAVWKNINEHMKIYDSLTGNIINRNPNNLDDAKSSKESYYYWLRKIYNEKKRRNTAVCAALFIILNKLCFRGVYRESKNGFNVPYGHYKTTPTIITKSELNIISELIKDVEFKVLDFSESIKKVKKDDFVYLDPPYAPETKTSFVDYTTAGFNLSQHKLLFSSLITLSKKEEFKFLLSNAKVKLVEDLFKDYTIENITARRAIHSKKPDSTTTEVLISN